MDARNFIMTPVFKDHYENIFIRHTKIFNQGMVMHVYTGQEQRLGKHKSKIHTVPLKHTIVHPRSRVTTKPSSIAVKKSEYLGLHETQIDEHNQAWTELCYRIELVEKYIWWATYIYA